MSEFRKPKPSAADMATVQPGAGDKKVTTSKGVVDSTGTLGGTTSTDTSVSSTPSRRLTRGQRAGLITLAGTSLALAGCSSLGSAEAADGAAGPSVAPMPSASAEAEQPTNVINEYRADGALAYPSLINPDPSRSPEFPNVPQDNYWFINHLGQKAGLVEYGNSFEDGDYFEQDDYGTIDVSQWHYRVMTAGHIKIDELGIDLQGDENTGVVVILVNHYGDDLRYEDAIVDNGFTVAGRVWDMETPEKTSLAGQALLDHYMGRMTMDGNPGANCSNVPDGCQNVKYAVVFIGDGEMQVKWSGTYTG